MVKGYEKSKRSFIHAGRLASIEHCEFSPFLGVVQSAGDGKHQSVIDQFGTGSEWSVTTIGSKSPIAGK
jgi:hypothetical protein